MRSRFINVAFAESDVDITKVPREEIERWARAERSRVLAMLLADGIVWLARLPRRLTAGTRQPRSGPQEA